MDRYIAVGTLDYRTYKGDMGLHLLRMDGNGELKMCHSSYDGLNATYVISGLKMDMRMRSVSAWMKCR